MFVEKVATGGVLKKHFASGLIELFELDIEDPLQEFPVFPYL